MNLTASSTASVLFLGALLCAPASAQQHKDLGRMWTFENAPMAWFQEAYDFKPSKEWLEHAQLSALRFGRGCSASFVSPEGLIMTNHHCARDNIAQVSPKDQDWLRDGFYAGGYDNEAKLPGLTVQQLLATKDITADVNARIAAGKSVADATAEAQKEADTADPTLTHQVVTLYQGGMFQLYSYKIWDDIRLVCAPHGQSAHFGGDPDNFCFPRWGLDFTFVRAYVDGKPADTSKHFFGWNTAGAKEGDLVFVVGNPGRTGRLQTYAQCEFLRDNFYPTQLAGIRNRLAELNAAADKDDPKKRAEILRFENTRKAFEGYMAGLQDERIMGIKRTAEAAIRKAVGENAELQKKYGDAWDKIADLQAKKAEVFGKPEAAKVMPGLQEQERAEQKRIGEAFFAVHGTSIPPDATLTLRLSDGVVKGYRMNGTVAPYFTSLYGLFARHTEFGGHHPFDLPKAWLDAKDKLDLTTPFNFAHTNDIIGGNSGSPVLDKDLKVIGLIFDGNIESLGNNYVFDDEVARSVSVHPAIIIEALRKIYGAGKLADELETGGKKR